MARSKNPQNTDWEILGSAIRTRRVSRGFTLVALAAKVDLSQPFLSQIENGRARPSMTSLYRIANALETTPQAFFGGSVDASCVPSLVRGEEAQTVDFDVNEAASSVHLFLAGEAPFHVLEYVGLPIAFGEYWEHDGFEAVYVVAGHIEIDIEGQVSALEKGDFLSYPSSIRHRLRSPDGESARALLIETKFEALKDSGAGGHAPKPRASRVGKKSLSATKYSSR